MKPFVVIKWDKDFAALSGVRRLTERDSGRFYLNSLKEYNWESDGEFNSPYYFTDTLNDAEGLVKILQEQNPFNSYLIAESKIIYQVKPGPIIRGIFSEAGLLPG